jgi:hypothetical protein
VAAPAENENAQLAPSENRSSKSADGRVATVSTRRRRWGLRPVAFTILTPILLPTVRASPLETSSILLSVLSLILTLENAWRSENALVVAGFQFRDIRFATGLAAVPPKVGPSADFSVMTTKRMESSDSKLFTRRSFESGRIPTIGP